MKSLQSFAGCLAAVLCLSAALAAILACPGGAKESADPIFDRLNREADAAIKKHNGELAKIKAEQMIERHPDSSRAFRQMARAQEQLHNYKAALVAINKAIAMGKDMRRCLIIRAKIYVENDQDNLARIDFRQVGKEEGQNADYYCGIAFELERLEDFEGAFVTLQRAMLVEPESGDVQKMVGRVLRELNRPAEAEEHLLNAIKLRGADDDILTNLALVHQALKKPLAVIADIDKVTADQNQRSEKLVDQYLLRARAYTSLGRYAKARRDYDRCIEIKPLQRKLYQGRLEISQKMGDKGAIARDTAKIKSLDKSIQPFNGF